MIKLRPYIWEKRVQSPFPFKGTDLEVVQEYKYTWEYC